MTEELPEPAQRIENTENLDQTLQDLLQHHAERLRS